MGPLARPAVAALAILMASATVAAAQEQQPATIVLIVHGASSVHEGEWSRAQSVVEAIYGAAGIRVIWQEGGRIMVDTPPGRQLSIVICSEKDHDVPPTVFGAAPGTKTTRGIRAYAFLDRIDAFSAANGLDAGHLLGHVIAHEVGHLLLPYGSHTSEGLMRKTWELEHLRRFAGGVMMLNTKQTRLLRQRLDDTTIVAQR